MAPTAREKQLMLATLLLETILHVYTVSEILDALHQRDLSLSYAHLAEIEASFAEYRKKEQHNA